MPRSRSLSTSAILKRITRAIKRPQRFLEFAEALGQGSSDEQREVVAKRVIEQIMPLVRLVFGDGANLTLHGSRAKWTHIDDSDFDYHIEGLGRAATLDDMYSLKNEIDTKLTGIVSTHRDIKVALSVTVMSSQASPQFIIEIVPEECDYMDKEVRATIEKADPYFREHSSARNVVRALKYMFLRTRPRLKNCEIEVAVQDIHRSGNDLPRREPEASFYLFIHVLRYIEDMAGNLASPKLQEYRSMVKLVSELGLHNRVASPDRTLDIGHQSTGTGCRTTVVRYPVPVGTTRTGDQEQPTAGNIMPDDYQILACLRAALPDGRLSVREIYLLSLGRDPAKEQMGTGIRAEMNRRLKVLKSQNAVTSVDGRWSLQNTGANSPREAEMPDEEQILACLRAEARCGRQSLPVREIYLLSLNRDPKRDQMGSGVRAKMERSLKALQSRGAVTCVTGSKEWSRWSLHD